MEARHHCCNRELITTLENEMTEAQLRELLSEETLAWAERSPPDIVAELARPQTYRRGTGDTWHAIEVALLEAIDDRIRVKSSINDGSLVWALQLITSSFPRLSRRSYRDLTFARRGEASTARRYARRFA
jgi:hypothetical protein